MGIMDGCHVKKYRMSEHWKQADYIVRKLCGVSPYMSNVRDTVKFIEEAGVENFDFDYPYGSFEAFKKHVLAGEFDVDTSGMFMTDEKQKKIEENRKEGILWVRY